MPRDVGEWSKNKLKILSDYLPVYLQATTRAIERIYIDGFAGPGLNRVKSSGEEIPGSPLVALDAKSKNGTRFDRLYFIERDTHAASELRNLVANRREEGKAQVIEGDVNVELPKLMAGLPKRSPTFVFLDTEGIEPRWTTIEALAGWQTELLINFPLGMSINRNPDSSKVTAYFGTNRWRELWNSPGRTRALLQLYKERLAELGYRHTTEDNRLIKTSGGRRLYYLVFVSKVDVAQRIMTWVLRQPDSAGQTRMDI